MKSELEPKTVLLLYGVAFAMPIFVLVFYLLLSAQPRLAAAIVPVFLACSLIAPVFLLRSHKSFADIPATVKKWMAVHCAEYVMWSVVITLKALKYPLSDAVTATLIAICAVLYIVRKSISKKWSLVAQNTKN